MSNPKDEMPEKVDGWNDHAKPHKADPFPVNSKPSREWFFEKCNQCLSRITIKRESSNIYDSHY